MTARHPATRLVTALCLLSVIAVLAGCGKKKTVIGITPSPQTPADAPVVPAAKAEAPPPPPGAVPPPPPDASSPSVPAEAKDAAPFPYDPALRAALNKFFSDNLHPATSWQELLAGKYIRSIPTGPDGKPIDWQKFNEAMAKAAGR